MQRSNRKLRTISFSILSLTFSLLLVSCGSSRGGFSNSDSQIVRLARAGIALGMDIDESDHWALFVEAAAWLHTPYRYAGKSHSGVDCSGLSAQIYKNVYGVKLQPNSIGQYQQDVKHISRHHLQQGDLVFFSSSPRRKRTVTHVGVYLKDDRFIHASTSKGVIVSNLNETYYQQRFVSGGRVR